MLYVELVVGFQEGCSVVVAEVHCRCIGVDWFEICEYKVLFAGLKMEPSGVVTCLGLPTLMI